MITVWIVEDNARYRRTLARLIDGAPDMEPELVAPSCEHVLEKGPALSPPEVILLDIGLPGMDGIAGAARFRLEWPASRVVMLTVHEENESVFRAICAGASGYLLKPSSSREILRAIRQVQQGGGAMDPFVARKVLRMFAQIAPPRDAAEDYGLTQREKEILVLLVDGLTAQQAAERLAVSYHTVNTHVRSIYDKLHVHSRGAAVSKALRDGLV